MDALCLCFTRPAPALPATASPANKTLNSTATPQPVPRPAALESAPGPEPARDRKPALESASDPKPAPGLIPCPLCAGEGRTLFSVHGYPVLECRRCQHRYAGVLPDEGHVAAVYDDRYFDGGGAGYDDYTAEKDLLIAHGSRYAALLARHGIAPGRQLDIGASCGFVMQGFIDHGWTSTGLEPNARMAAHGRRTSGLDIRVGTAETLPAALTAGPAANPPEGSFDLISIIQVLAHFHDIRAALSRLRARTRPGGWWLIETWDHRSVSARLAGQRWHEYSPPSVLHWFSRPRLIALLAEYGLVPVAQGRPRKFLRGSHARSILEHKLGGSVPGRWLLPMTRAIPEDLAIPYPADDVFWLLCRLDPDAKAEAGSRSSGD